MIEIDPENSIIWKILTPNHRNKIQRDMIINRGYSTVNGCKLTMMVVSSLFWTVFLFSFLTAIALAFSYIIFVPWFNAVDYYLNINFFANTIVYQSAISEGIFVNYFIGIIYILYLILGWIVELCFFIQNYYIDNYGDKHTIYTKTSRINILKQYISDRKQKICPTIKFKIKNSDQEK